MGSDHEEIGQDRSESDSPTVLIVEDEPGLADLYAAWLEDRCIARTVYGGDKALEQMDDSVDIVLLDRQMPGVTGTEVLNQIRDRGYDCRVAMVTAVEPDFDIVEMEFDTYLSKPVTQSEIRTAVNQLLRLDDYGDAVQEYLILASKRALLQTKGQPTDPDQTVAYNALETRLEELQTEVDTSMDSIDRHETELDPLSAMLQEIE